MQEPDEHKPISVEELNALFLDEAHRDFAIFEYDEENNRYTGRVVSHVFSGVSVANREKHVWDRLNSRFGEEAEKVSLVVTYTPFEWLETTEAP